jgi:hypothetical protein
MREKERLKRDRGLREIQLQHMRKAPTFFFSSFSPNEKPLPPLSLSLNPPLSLSINKKNYNKK